MSDDNQLGRFILDRLGELREDVGEVRSGVSDVGEKVESLRIEVQATYARESDCVTRAAHEQEFRSESIKRVWGKLDEHGDLIHSVKARVAKLESHRSETVVEHRVKSSLWKWATAAATAAGLATYGAWLRGCL
jgi:hypothetical protein